MLEGQQRVAEVSGGALFAVIARRVMSTIDTNASATVVTLTVHLFVERAPSSMIIALTLFASVHLLTNGRSPWQIVEQVFAAFTVSAGRVMIAFALSVHHSGHLFSVAVRHTFRSMTPAEASTAHLHLRHGIVVLVLDLFARVQQIVAERVKASEVDAQIGDAHQILNLSAVRIVDLEVGRKHLEQHVASVARHHRTVRFFANHVAQSLRFPMRNVRENVAAIGGKVMVRFPRSTAIRRSFDQHGGRTKSGELEHHPRKLKRGLQIQLNVDFLHAIFGLPPASAVLHSGTSDHILDRMILEQRTAMLWAVVTHVTLLELLCRNDHTVPLRSGHSASAGRLKTIGSTNQQIANTRVTAGHAVRSGT
jgi:hypothetical protein